MGNPRDDESRSDALALWGMAELDGLQPRWTDPSQIGVGIPRSGFKRGVPQSGRLWPAPPHDKRGQGRGLQQQVEDSRVRRRWSTVISGPGQRAARSGSLSDSATRCQSPGLQPRRPADILVGTLSVDMPV